MKRYLKNADGWCVDAALTCQLSYEGQPSLVHLYGKFPAVLVEISSSQ